MLFRSSTGRLLNQMDFIIFAIDDFQIGYVAKQGLHSTRDIEAYSLRRSKAGDVLLMAVRADNGQARSYFVEKILGAKPTLKSFTPRYPIELTPSGLQNTVLPRIARR